MSEAKETVLFDKQGNQTRTSDLEKMNVEKGKTNTGSTNAAGETPEPRPKTRKVKPKFDLNGLKQVAGTSKASTTSSVNLATGEVSTVKNTAKPETVAPAAPTAAPPKQATPPVAPVTPAASVQQTTTVAPSNTADTAAKPTTTTQQTGSGNTEHRAIPQGATAETPKQPESNNTLKNGADNMSQENTAPTAEVTAPTAEVTAPVADNTAPVAEVTAPASTSAPETLVKMDLGAAKAEDSVRDPALAEVKPTTSEHTTMSIVPVSELGCDLETLRPWLNNCLTRWMYCRTPFYGAEGKLIAYFRVFGAYPIVAIGIAGTNKVAIVGVAPSRMQDMANKTNVKDDLLMHAGFAFGYIPSLLTTPAVSI